MRTAILVASLLLTAGLGLVAEPVAAEDPTEWCNVGENEHGPTFTCGPKGPICLGVGIDVQHYCT